MAHRDGDPFAMCSTFKAYAAARVLQQAEHGELELQQAVFIDPAALVPNSPVAAPQAGHVMTLAQLCAAALQRSDNAAANLLLQAIGGPTPSPSSPAPSATTAPVWIAGRLN